MSSRPHRRRKNGDVVVVHSSDLHIDDDYTARFYGGDGTRGLALVLEAARSLSADAVILAGDLFEHNRLGLGLFERTARLLQAAALPVVILPGNHDPLTAESAFIRGRVGEVPNVHVLGLGQDSSATLEGLDLEVWGNPHRDYGDMAPLRSPRPRAAGRLIAVAHGHYEPVPDLSRFPRASWLLGDAEIEATGADYVALGHWNRPVKVGAGAVEAHYCGSPELARSVNIVRMNESGGVSVGRHPLAGIPD